MGEIRNRKKQNEMIRIEFGVTALLLESRRETPIKFQQN